MKFTHVFHTFLMLMVASAFGVLMSDFRENDHLKQRYQSGYQTEMAALSFVARMNYLRVKMPGKSSENLIQYVYPRLPEGFVMRSITEAERNQFVWLKESDFLVEQAGPPFLVIPSDGYFLHLNLKNPGDAINLNPVMGASGAQAP